MNRFSEVVSEFGHCGNRVAMRSRPSLCAAVTQELPPGDGGRGWNGTCVSRKGAVAAGEGAGLAVRTEVCSSVAQRSEGLSRGPSPLGFPILTLLGYSIK